MVVVVEAVAVSVECVVVAFGSETVLVPAETVGRQRY